MERDGGSEAAAPGASGAGSLPFADSREPVIDNRLFVLVLQHPQERSEERATAALLVAMLRYSRLAVGLSWPNLARALGQQPGQQTGRRADHSRWGVLHLGSARPSRAARPPHPAHRGDSPGKPPRGGTIIALGRDGSPLPDADRLLGELDGIILLDGTWSQAKTLWWRNPWLLKLHRLVLNPPEPARLGRIRREPRREALSTLEAASLVLRHVEPNPEAADMLLAALGRLIAEQGERAAGASVRGGDVLQNRRSRDARRPARYRGRSATW